MESKLKTLGYPGDETNLIDRLLADQKNMTAVERFSQKHKNLNAPAQQPYYKDLIPIRKPLSEEQYSFSVDLDKCTGCKACVVACHSRNGLSEDESWRDVGKIVSQSTDELQTVTSACHHCAEPACLNGCPVGAYEKMPQNGIVKHLDDQCIGCEYCVLKCPYDVPKYNKELGIVRKCDLCHDRLEEGEAPACVQSCPNGAIKIELVNNEQIYERAAERESIIAGAFRSNYTYPTSRYFSKRNIPTDMKAVDERTLEASHKHTPLSWMLMLTQVSVGVLLVEYCMRITYSSSFLSISIPMLTIAFVLGLVGLVSSIFHLGSPLGAWRVFLGLKTSWLSREIILFGLWFPFLCLYFISAFFINMDPVVPILGQEYVMIPSHYELGKLSAILGFIAVLFGILSVFCSVMVYVDTKRIFWSFKRTITKFFGTMLVGGSVVLLLVSNFFTEHASDWIWFFAIITLLAKAMIEIESLLPALHRNWTSEKRSALIQLITLKNTLHWRWYCFFLCILFAVFSGWYSAFSVISVICLLIGEWLERQLFFQAVETLKMPGNLTR